MNLVIISGRLGAQPEIKYLPSGMALCELRVATSERYTDKQTGQPQERTEWHSCTLWGKQAQAAAQYLEKGQAVTIRGKLRTRSWDMQGVTRQDGTAIKAYKTDIIVEVCEWGAKARGAQDGQAVPHGAGAGAPSGNGGARPAQGQARSAAPATLPQGAAQAYSGPQDDPGIIEAAAEDIPF